MKNRRHRVVAACFPDVRADRRRCSPKQQRRKKILVRFAWWRSGPSTAPDSSVKTSVRTWPYGTSNGTIPESKHGYISSSASSVCCKLHQVHDLACVHTGGRLVDPLKPRTLSEGGEGLRVLQRNVYIYTCDTVFRRSTRWCKFRRSEPKRFLQYCSPACEHLVSASYSYLSDYMVNCVILICDVIFRAMEFMMPGHFNALYMNVLSMLTRRPTAVALCLTRVTADQELHTTN